MVVQRGGGGLLGRLRRALPSIFWTTKYREIQTVGKEGRTSHMSHFSHRFVAFEGVDIQQCKNLSTYRVLNDMPKHCGEAEPQCLKRPYPDLPNSRAHHKSGWQGRTCARNVHHTNPSTLQSRALSVVVPAVQSEAYLNSPWR